MDEKSIEGNDLEHAIVSTIAYYDLFEYPLTLLELWQYLIAPAPASVTPGDIAEALEESALLTEHIQSDHGFYFLKGREGILRVRRDRSTIAVRKIRCARAFARLAAAVPFVRFIGVCNTVGLRHASEESDIDFLVIAQGGALWLVRACTTTLAHLLGVRPHQRGRMKDTMCLSFFLSDAAFNLESSALPERGGVHDVYLAAWTGHITPLFDERDTFSRLHDANRWTSVHRPNMHAIQPPHSAMVQLWPIARWIKRLGEVVLSPLLSFFEDASRTWQLSILPRELKELMNRDTRVVLRDTMLKLHHNDRREEIRSAWVEKIQSL
ncbi:MAG: hypothetical protein AAB416_00645 [Patescibacteria group bacterium]